jgi:pilus assembly protein CpaF
VVTLQELFSFKVDRVTPERVVIGSLQPTGLRPSFITKFEKRGIELPLSLFGGGLHAADLVSHQVAGGRAQ